MHKENVIRRVVIEGVKPEIDGGRFPIKRTVGESVTVSADIFTDTHDVVSGVMMHRKAEASDWNEVPLEFIINDRWQASFDVTQVGRYVYTLSAWVDSFQSWRRDLSKKVDANQTVSIELLAGAQLIQEVSNRAGEADAEWLKQRAEALRSSRSQDVKVVLAMDDVLAGLMEKYPDRHAATTYDKELIVVVDREIARFSAWYEMFPRSCGKEPGKHGTLKDCVDRLPYIARMGFDVLYLPPVHPIGVTHRKGRNNAPSARSPDPGSPWAIGAAEGGHRDLHPLLGTLEDFRHLVEKARDYGIEVALDLAFQCSPDHPYVAEHPEWFRKRPDGSIQYAENPPKKYQDIYPFDFERDRWRELVQELRTVVYFWIDQGVRIFRVDNPHTKPFSFWDWLINTVKSEYPDIIFLSEAFTRPKIMYRLAKLGFTQSYTYFAWRNSAWEIEKYFTELTQTDLREYFRPNLWPNTPDVLPEYLQMGGREGFMSRLVLAATLGANYGIYGPAFELCVDKAKEPGSEEYLDSEKYEIRYWHIDQPQSLKDFIARVNRARRENPALQNDNSLCFHPTGNEQLLCYSKQASNLSNTILIVVNLDPHHTQTGWVDIDMAALNLDPDLSYQVHDLLSDARYLWNGPHNYVEINPKIVPAHIFRIRRKVRTERDFDYFL